MCMRYKWWKEEYSGLPLFPINFDKELHKYNFYNVHITLHCNILYMCRDGAFPSNLRHSLLYLPPLLRSTSDLNFWGGILIHA